MALISCEVTAQLIMICGFVYAYANCWFYHAVAHFRFNVSVVNRRAYHKNDEQKGVFQHSEHTHHGAFRLTKRNHLKKQKEV